jgi:hypothetical protein
MRAVGGWFRREAGSGSFLTNRQPLTANRYLSQQIIEPGAESRIAAELTADSFDQVGECRIGGEFFAQLAEQHLLDEDFTRSLCVPGAERRQMRMQPPLDRLAGGKRGCVAGGVGRYCGLSAVRGRRGGATGPQ